MTVGCFAPSCDRAQLPAASAADDRRHLVPAAGRLPAAGDVSTRAGDRHPGDRHPGDRHPGDRHPGVGGPSGRSPDGLGHRHHHHRSARHLGGGAADRGALPKPCHCEFSIINAAVEKEVVDRLTVSSHVRRAA